MNWTIKVIGCLMGFLAGLPQGHASERLDRRDEVRVDAVAKHDGEAPPVNDLLDRMPLVFEENRGQFDARAKYLMRGAGYKLFITGRESTIVLDADRSDKAQAPAVLQMRFLGASRAARVEGRDAVEQRSNYFLGGKTTRSYTDIPNFAKVAVRSVYPGVDVVYYGSGRELEYDLVVAPKADPGRIRLNIQGAKSTSITTAGDLRLSTTAGDLVLRRPVAYQEVGGERRPVPVDYVTGKGANTVGFRIAAYDRDKPLVIDPVLSYSTGLGGYSTTQPNGVAVDAQGHAFVVGSTDSTSFPTASAYQNRLKGSRDVFVTKLNAAGTGVLYSTYLGGARSVNDGRAIAIDPSGNAYVTGTVTSATFPVTAGAYQTQGASGSSFLAKLGPLGNTLAYSTYINGASSHAVTVDPDGQAYVAGQATSAFQSSPTALQTSNHGGYDGFVLKMNAAGSALAYATFLGGGLDDGINGIAIDSSDNVYVVGDTASADFPVLGAVQGTRRGNSDAFVTKIDVTGGSLIYSTYLGGNDDESGKGIAVDSEDNAYAVGVTWSMDFPVLNAFQSSHGLELLGASGNIDNAFITKLNPAGNALVYSSYLGGAACLSATVNFCFSAEGDGALAVAVDAMGNAYLSGYAASVTFPKKDSFLQTTFNNVALPFVAKVRPDGQILVYSVVFGRDDGFSPYTLAASGVGLDPQGNLYVVGRTFWGEAFHPITPGALDTITTGFVAKLGRGAILTTLSSASNPTCAGQTTTLTAQVAKVRDTADGAVTFYDGTTSLGSVPEAMGQATLAAVLPAGIHKLTAVYSGDGQVSPPFYQTVRLPAACP